MRAQQENLWGTQQSKNHVKRRETQTTNEEETTKRRRKEKIINNILLKNSVVCLTPCKHGGMKTLNNFKRLKLIASKLANPK